ncbi:MAG TPA: flagellin [Candidatus Binatia bacterium]|nr:flagellin [Candidatus Binatia bacterium]
MGVRINTNIEALIAQRNLALTGTQLGRSVEKLSSGLRINRAADDAAGLAISEKLRAQVRGLNQASRNAQDAISMVQTAEGALNEVHAMLQRIRELAVQYNNGTNDSGSQAAIEAEVEELADAIGKVASQTKFNGVALLSGTGTTVTFQVGANDGETLDVTFGGLDSGVAAVSAFIDSGNISAVFSSGTATISAVDDAINYVSGMRGTFGAAQNRLEHTINSLNVAAENLAASESRIRDLDVAAEMVTFTKLQILQQAGTAILAQANQAPQSVLALLR